MDKEKTAAIDFETVYDKKNYSVTDMGTYAYTHDPRFEIINVAVSCSDGFEFVGKFDDCPWSKLLAEYPRWLSHNAGFDEAVYRRAQKLAGATTMGFLPEKWDCTADLAAYHQHPRALAKLAPVLFNEHVSKAVRNKMSGMGSMKQGEFAFAGPSEAEINEYALNDSRYCLRFWETLSGDWPGSERRLSRHTRKLHFHGTGFDLVGAKRMLGMLDELIAEAYQEIPWTKYGAPPASLKHFKAFCRDAGIIPPTTTAESKWEWQQWLHDYEDKAPFARALNRYRALNRTQKVIQAMIMRSDGVKIYPELKYYGAERTGRWSGGAKFNLQNLNSKEIAPGIDLRALIRPQAGNKFIICDFSQIEPRSMAAICRDEELLGYLRQGIDIYEAHARTTMGYDDPRPLKEVDRDMRQMAKIRVLGMGYGAGGAVIQRLAKGYGVDLTEEEAASQVYDFRAKAHRTTWLWSMMDRSFKNAHGMDMWAAKVKTGRPLRYFHIADGRAATLSDGSRREKLWGGSLVQNLIQATARDILGDAILEIERAGIPVNFHIHDEVVCEVPEKDAPEALKEVERIMSKAPDWLPNIPIACEGHIADKYEK